MNPAVEIDRKKIEAFSQRWKVDELAVFGSALRDDFGPDSDVDILVTFQPGAGFGLFDLVRMEDELKEMFGRDVDLLTKRSVEVSRNYIRRRDILASLETVYVAG
jgi:predicted nucleotidyltransferase